tara:strand:+ start:126 stop:1367 length:1242 start_codon:yes stop_codon:yes gene_type:complete
MKKTFVSIVLLLSCSFFVSAADIYVNNSGQPGTYTSINAAVAAANSGDNVYISPFSVYTEVISIDKSLSLISAVSGTNFNVIGGVTIDGFGSGEVKLIGLSCTGSVNGAIGSSTLFNETVIYIIDCVVNGASFYNAHHTIVNMYFSTFTGTSRIHNGDIRGNTFNSYLRVEDGPNLGMGSTVSIIGNHFTGGDIAYLAWYNDDHYFYIANNLIEKKGAHIIVSKHHFNTFENNVIANNTFIPGEDDPCIYSYCQGTGSITINSQASSQANIIFINNLLTWKFGNLVNLTNDLGSTGSSTNVTKPKLYNNIYYSQSGFHLIAGNVAELYYAISINPLEERLLDSTYIIDRGFSSLEYYDIDMSTNDIGIHGGPHAIDNYRSSGSGRARVINLDMPFEIWSGQTPQVNAKAAHTK